MTPIEILSTLIAFSAIIISIITFKRSNTETSYLDIDKQYSELLKLSLETPNLRSHDSTTSFYKLNDDDDFKKKYNIYAYMCWNLVETIYDKQKDKNGRFKLSPTWTPVMLEENKLHYTWFKHNLRLFKPEFQKFVTSELNEIDIIKGNIKDLRSIYSSYERTFPQNELKALEHLEVLMLKENYFLILAKHKVFNEIIGYAFLYKNDKNKVLWLDYMAIDEKYQNSGYGTLLFNKIIESETQGVIGIFMEVEIPESSDKTEYSNQLKREKFYKRLGAQKLSFNYIMPTNEGGTPLNLFFKPVSNLTVLPETQIKEAIAAAFNYIHTDVNNRDKFLKSFIGEIKDVYFN